MEVVWIRSSFIFAGKWRDIQRQDTQVFQLFIMGKNASLYFALYIMTFRNITSTFDPPP